MMKGLAWLTLLLAAQFASASTVLADPIQDALNATKNGDTAAAQAAYQKLTQSTDPKVQAAIGVALFNGIGVPVNHPAALHFLQEASLKGRPDAQFYLAEAYNDSWADPDIAATFNDPPQDYNFAAGLYAMARQSATALLQSGDPAAEITMAELMSGNLAGLNADNKTIQSLASTAAQQGNVDAEVFYGNHFAESKTPDGQATWKKWMMKAAMAGDSDAYVEIANDLIQRNDLDHALPWLKEAALLNNAAAACMLKHSYKLAINCAVDPTPEEQAMDQDAMSLFAGPTQQSDAAQPGQTAMAQDDAASKESFQNKMDLFGILAVSIAAEIASEPPPTQAQIKASNDRLEGENERVQAIEDSENEESKVECETSVNNGLMAWCP